MSYRTITVGDRIKELLADGYLVVPQPRGLMLTERGWAVLSAYAERPATQKVRDDQGPTANGIGVSIPNWMRRYAGAPRRRSLPPPAERDEPA